MRKNFTFIGTLALAAAIAAPVFTTGCGDHHYYRAYDPYYNDYHQWDARENGYYAQWEREGHHDHRDFKKRSEAEQKEYYAWRHNHEDKDHDHDHDHDHDKK